MNNSIENKKHVVVIGGGFSGLNFVTRLYKSPDYHITLVDKNNYNYFTPLVYQVATGFLDPSSITYPFRKILKNKDVTYRMASLERINPDERSVYLSDGGTLKYDYLVLAAGTKTNFFGNENIQTNSFSLKGIDDALYIRNEMVKKLEKASIENDPLERKRLMTIVIAGGGPTGVEVAGMLAEMRKYILQKDYPNLNPEEQEIYIVDGSPYLLQPMSDKTHEAAYKALDKLGVRIILNTQVRGFKDGKVELSDGEFIETHNLLWSAGVTSNIFEGIPQTAMGKGGRIFTDAYCRSKDYENIFVIGDMGVQFDDPAYPTGHPQLAQPAIQQGKQLAKNFKRIAEGQPMKPFSYFDRGEMAIIGRRTAVADLFKHKLHLGGLLGLLSWLFIHIVSLVNYNNIIKTLYNWAVAYLTRDQALRMIFRSGNRENKA
ncbi:NAD(P)/FAD-dependent oxidoreductase [Mucilaginibacter pocheonensis]|uniref:NADH:ubiquinone reductase (non-electrogenic) n=1 Tax=Mucilaginibacter pocheonensis TaxID=398050 RepID=A0ABU1TES4_9SPHI|nr:NAD(P)/FAD-dependent oxidoreductase [Mucilaginibacter pocheonensis]MDR6943759.1 NADH dehydrogenase [Mucilaginibacter pocheonensis]